MIIGQDLDEALVRSVLDECLLTDDEMRLSVEEWSQLDDPFPDWSVDEADEELSDQPTQFVVPRHGETDV